MGPKTGTDAYASRVLTGQHKTSTTLQRAFALKEAKSSCSPSALRREVVASRRAAHEIDLGHHTVATAKKSLCGEPHPLTTQVRWQAGRRRKKRQARRRCARAAASSVFGKL